MPATTIPAQVMNPYVGPSPKNIPTDVEMRFWAEWVEKFERKETPITNLIPRGKTAYWGNKIRVGQRYNPFLTTAVKVAVANNAASIDIDSTAGWRVGDIGRITDYQAGSTTALDYSTVEYFRTTAVTDSDTLAVTRDMDQTASGSWPTHAVDALVELVSRATPNNTTFAPANVHRGDFTFQFGQLFESSLETSIQAIHAKSEESDNYWKDDRANVVTDLKYQRENAFATGIRMAGDETSTPTKPFTMGGIVYQIENFASANVNDLSNAQLSLWDVNDLLMEVWGTHRKGAGTHVMGHQTTISIWDGITWPFKVAGGGNSLNDTTFNTRTTKGSFRWADVTPVPTITIPPGILVFIDPSDWEWNNFEGEDWHEERQEPDQIWKPNEAWAMWGRFAIICKDIQRQAMITNIQTDYSQYSYRSAGQP